MPHWIDTPTALDAQLQALAARANTEVHDVVFAVAPEIGAAHAQLRVGQLERELTQHSWLTVPSDPQLLFDTPLDARWRIPGIRLLMEGAMQQAAQPGRQSMLMGVDCRPSPCAGHLE